MKGNKTGLQDKVFDVDSFLEENNAPKHIEKDFEDIVRKLWEYEEKCEKLNSSLSSIAKGFSELHKYTKRED